MKEPSPRIGSARRPPPPKRERARKIKAIQAEFDAKRRELGLRAPSMRRGPAFYLGLMAVLAVMGLSLVKATDSGKAGVRVRNAKMAQAARSVDAFAEALGRFKFHCGEYPTAEEGLAALATKDCARSGWIGPYIKSLKPDPWKRAYIYEPTNDPPVVLSLGPDGERGTADDIAPDQALFSKPFRDSSWTNDWAPHWKRGYIIVPSRK